MCIFRHEYWKGLVGAVIGWPLFLLVRTFFILLGYVMVPTAVLCRAYKEVDSEFSNKHQKIYLFTWKIMAPWQNYEDGFAWNTYKDFGSLLLNAIYWSCFRNPANGLRFLPITGFKLDVSRIGFVGTFGTIEQYRIHEEFNQDLTWVLRFDESTPQWYFAWQGLYSNFFWHFKLFGKLFRFWIGFKVFPKSLVLGVPEYQKKGVGFATQLKQVKRSYFNHLD